MVRVGVERYIYIYIFYPIHCKLKCWLEGGVVDSKGIRICEGGVQGACF